MAVAKPAPGANTQEIAWLQPAPAPAGMAIHPTPSPETANASTNSPARQIAPAMVALVTGPGGARSMTLRLDPAELGHVLIRVDQKIGSGAEIMITVQRAETLALLRQDHLQLHAALDQAGIAPEGRQVTLQIAPPADVPPAAGSTPGSGGGIGAGAGNDAAGAGGGNGNNTPGHRPGGGNPDDPAQDGRATANAVRWMRAGIDITA